MLFDDNELFNIPGMPYSEYKRDNKIVSSTEGFLKGNMFKDEYVPYKNMTYFKLKATSSKEELLFKIMELCFAINDLNLWLDLHNDDMEAFKLFKKYSEEKEKLSDMYAQKYQSLCLDDINNNFDWVSSFPWDNMRGDIYV